jgi:signal transduction histidine kinase
MLQFDGLTPHDGQHPIQTEWRRCGEIFQKFFHYRFADMSFRRRLFFGTIFLLVAYGLIVTTTGALLLQPSLMRQTCENSRARSAHIARYLEPILSTATSLNGERLKQTSIANALDDLLKADDILHCVVYTRNLQSVFEKGSSDHAKDAELNRLLADLPNHVKPIDYVISRNGIQKAFVTIHPLLAEAKAEDTRVAQASQLISTASLSAPPLVGFIRLDYNLAFVREQRVKFYQLNLLIMALFLGLGIGLAMVLNRGLHRPMRQLIDGAHRIGNGDLDHRIDIQGHNELVLLGKSFNRMASRLKLREGQLQRSEALYRHLIQDALDGIFVVDRELRFIEVNEKFCEMFGCRREDLLQSTLSEVMAKTTGAEEYIGDILSRRPFRGELAIQPRTELALVSSLHQGKLSAFVDYAVEKPQQEFARAFNEVNANGAADCRFEKNRSEAALRNLFFARTIDLNAAPINDELYMGIARDVTEKKHYEAELYRAAELRELLLRTMSDGIAVLDRAGYLLICNRALEEIFEMPQVELLQNRFLEFRKGWQIQTLEDDSLPPHRHPVYLALNQEKRSSDCRLKMCRAEKEKYLSVNSAPLYDERQQLIGAIVALRDITATVKNERAREILQQQMQQTAKLASLGELAAGVAHEINNPMTGIINYAQILYDRAPKNEEKQFLLQGILRESDRVTKIVHNLLTFSRQQPQEYNWFSLAEMLESSLHLMEHRLRKDGINLVCEVSPDLPPLKCRSQQIQQVLINLLSNAHHALNEKYAGHHENKLLKIAASVLQRNDRSFIRMEFYDTGIGIAPEIMPKIFDPFFTTKKRADGTGLGLSISYGIIKEHQGDIFVESQLGEHTAFIVELPLEHDDIKDDTMLAG